MCYILVHPDVTYLPLLHGFDLFFVPFVWNMIGFGIYIDDASFSRYRRVVQRLAQQGKLAVVFSDESLVREMKCARLHALNECGYRLFRPFEADN